LSLIIKTTQFSRTTCWSWLWTASAASREAGRSPT